MQLSTQSIGLIVLLCAGCNARPAAVAVQGEVSYQGQVIEQGKIDFVPIENTPGPSACAVIARGRYEVPARWGLLPEGVYLVRIVAYAKTGKKEPVRGIAGNGLVEVKENFIPATYNTESTLKLRVADLSDKSKADFHLGKTPAATPR
jgi:hypothetical protein